MTTHQELLDKWSKEYGLDPSKTTFVGLEDLGGSLSEGFTLGVCRWGNGKAEVALGNRFDGTLGWLETSVLWHEMCHAIAYLEDLKGNGHDARWRELRNSKKGYMIGDWVAKLVYLFKKVKQ